MNDMLHYDRPLQILLVEDDVNLGYLLMENLKANKMSVTLAKNGTQALELLRREHYDLCVLDIMMPDIDGFKVAAAVQNKIPGIPFIFLTSLSQDKDKHHGFEAGADDYITKPFNFKELHYRILAVARRGRPHMAVEQNTTIKLGTLCFNPAMRELNINGSRRKISHREASLLYILLQHRNSFINRFEIMQRIWGADNSLAARSMEVYVTRLRKLLKEDPAFEIENLYGEGYRISYNP